MECNNRTRSDFQVRVVEASIKSNWRLCESWNYEKALGLQPFGIWFWMRYIVFQTAFRKPRENPEKFQSPQSDVMMSLHLRQPRIHGIYQNQVPLQHLASWFVCPKWLVYFSVRHIGIGYGSFQCGFIRVLFRRYAMKDAWFVFDLLLVFIMVTWMKKCWLSHATSYVFWIRFFLEPLFFP